MPVIRARFRPNHSVVDGMGAQMMSGDTADVASWSARQAVMAALTLSPRGESSDPYVAHFNVDATVTTIDGKPRRSSRVVNDSDHAAAVEFGSGERNAGQTGPNPRPQGGFNNPRRVLARAGDLIGEYQARD